MKEEAFTRGEPAEKKKRPYDAKSTTLSFGTREKMKKKRASLIASKGGRAVGKRGGDLNMLYTGTEGETLEKERGLLFQKRGNTGFRLLEKKEISSHWGRPAPAPYQKISSTRRGK